MGVKMKRLNGCAEAVLKKHSLAYDHTTAKACAKGGRLRFMKFING